MTPIFYVYQPETGYTRYQHATLESAAREAERLAMLHPSQPFQVLAALSQVVHSGIEWDHVEETHVENEADGIPF
jgi:hypothetical protein